MQAHQYKHKLLKEKNSEILKKLKIMQSEKVKEILLDLTERKNDRVDHLAILKFELQKKLIQLNEKQQKNFISSSPNYINILNQRNEIIRVISENKNNIARSKKLIELYTKKLEIINMKKEFEISGLNNKINEENQFAAKGSNSANQFKEFLDTSHQNVIKELKEKAKIISNQLEEISPLFISSIDSYSHFNLLFLGFLLDDLNANDWNKDLNLRGKILSYIAETEPIVHHLNQVLHDFTFLQQNNLYSINTSEGLLFFFLLI